MIGTRYIAVNIYLHRTYGETELRLFLIDKCIEGRLFLAETIEVRLFLDDAANSSPSMLCVHRDRDKARF